MVAIEVEQTGVVKFVERIQAIKQGLTILQDKCYLHILVNLVA